MPHRMLPRRALLPLALTSALGAGAMGCAGGTPPPSAPSSTDGATSSAPASDAGAPLTKRAPNPLVLGPAPAALPAPASSCARPGPLPPPRACSGALALLADGLELQGAEQDAALAAIEGCTDFPRGLVRALRAENAPACGDALVEDVVGSEPTESDAVPRELRAILVGLGLAARLERAGEGPPPAPSPPTKAALQTYFQEQLFPWATERATAIGTLATQGAKLDGYARGMVAVAAASADMAFVKWAREVPIPAEIAEDAELAEVYYSSLDEALEPRKERGRDAALVGMADLARAGVLSSPSLTRARGFLGWAYGGRRIDALDALLIPALPLPPPKLPSSRVAERVATPYAEMLGLGVADARETRLALARRGLPLSLERTLTASPHPEDRELLAHMLFERGRLYMQSGDFRRAANLLAALDVAKLDDALASRARFVSALASALAGGPENAAALLAGRSRISAGPGALDAIDRLAAAGTGSERGAATFDAAYLRELMAPEGAPEHFKDVARRYRAAAKLLPPGDRARAEQYARHADETAAAISRDLKPAPK